jgi:hypothetical protein
MADASSNGITVPETIPKKPVQAPSNFSGTTTKVAFSLGMLMLSGVFWVVGLIPVVNIFSNTAYWIIWAIIYIARFRKNFTSKNILRVTVTVAISYILGDIPFVDWIPWDMAGTWITTKILEK